MKLSTKGKYGLKAIFELSLHVDEGPMSVNMIASKQNIPEQYLEQIFSKIEKSQTSYKCKRSTRRIFA